MNDKLSSTFIWYYLAALYHAPLWQASAAAYTLLGTIYITIYISFSGCW